MFVGIAARKKSILTDSAISSISRCVTNFFYPCLIVSSITSNFTTSSLVSNWALPIGTIIIMGTGYIIGVVASRCFAFENEKEKNTFLFQCTINNYVFLPLPIIAMLFGKVGVGLLIFSSLGSEISVWTIGILGLTGNHIGSKSIKNLISVPICALIFSIIIVLIRDIFAGSQIFSNMFLKETIAGLANAIDILGQASVPVALFVAGGRMFNLSIKDMKTPQQLGACFLRLIFIPAVACVFLALLPVSREIFLVLAVVSIMPSAIVSIILSETYKADTNFASSNVLITHICSLITVPAWLTFLMK